MGKRGPQPENTKKLENRGSTRVSSRKDEPEPGAFDDTCPDWLDDIAKQKWYKIVPQLKNLGVLGDVDSSLVAQYCHWWSKFIWGVTECPNDIHIQAKATDYLIKLGGRMGMSPSDRVGLQTTTSKKKDKDDKKYSIKFG